MPPYHKFYSHDVSQAVLLPYHKCLFAIFWTPLWYTQKKFCPPKNVHSCLFFLVIIMTHWPPKKIFSPQTIVSKSVPAFGRLKIEIQKTGQIWGYFYTFGAPEGSQKDNNKSITWNMIVFGQFVLVWGSFGLFLGLKFWCFYVMFSIKALLGSSTVLDYTNDIWIWLILSIQCQFGSLRRHFKPKTCQILLFWHFIFNVKIL